MGRRNKNADKKRAAKRKQREQRVRQRRVEHARASSWKERMQRAARWPLLECRLGAGYPESSLAQVLIARRGADRIAIAFFLVDLACLGVKDCMRADDLDTYEYEEVLEDFGKIEALEPCDPALAVKLVSSGANYAAGLGFRPHPDYATARAMFGDIDPNACAEPVSVGRLGRPLYVEGPNDDTLEILRRLEEHVGPDGFDFEPLDEAGEVQFPDESDPDPDRRLWGRLRRTEAGLFPQLLDFARDRHGADFVARAGRDFGPEAIDLSQADQLELLLPWILYRWTPKPPSSEPDGAQPIALEFVHAHADRIDAFERRFLEAVCERPLSFYVVESVEPGHGMDLRDVFSGHVHSVWEVRYSEEATVDDILYARVLPFDRVAILVGMSTLLIPPDFLIELEELRDELAGGSRLLTEQEVRAADDVLREVYWGISEEFHLPASPVLQNTDGELHQPCRVVFDLRCTPREALSRLKDMALDLTEEHLLRSAQFDADGNLLSALFPWLVAGNQAHASWSNTLLGHLYLAPGELAGTVNSEARAERLRGEVERRLGADAAWRETEREPLDDALEPKLGLRRGELGSDEE